MRDLQWESDVSNPVRQLAFYFALAAIFIRFSVIHEVLAVVLHLNLYLLYLIMPPALLAVAATGGIRRTLAYRSTRYWIAFLVWLFVAALFSSWRGGSAPVVLGYLKGEYLMLFVAGGLAMTWKECKQVMLTLALAAVTDLGISRIFMKQDSDRITLNMGQSTIANANDFAVHMILMMGILLYIVLAPSMPKIFRFACIPAIVYGGYLILSSGSRGALVAICVCGVFVFLTGSAKYRIAVIAIVPVMLVALISLLPHSTLLRLSTVVMDSGDVSVAMDAEGSTEARRELLRKSIVYTVEHPLFGIGPGQFSNFEGGESAKDGKHGIWHETHNTLTQISAECGIPAVIFFLLGIGSGMWLVLITYRQSRKTPGNADIAAASFSLLLGMVGFYSACFFVSFGYRFYTLALSGFCCVLYNAAQHEMAARKLRGASSPPAAAPWAPFNPTPSLAGKRV